MSTTQQSAEESALADRGKKSTFDIAVNGELVVVREERISFEDLVEIAFPISPGPDTVYTITYRGAKGRRREGELAPGESVTVKKKGTSFDVYPTGKS